MTPDDYLTAVADRLRADGATVTTEDFRGAPAVVGHRSEFRWSWLATQLHLFTIVRPENVVTAEGLERFAKDTLDYALARKGQLRGLQKGVAAIPVLVGAQVEPDAVEFARRRLVRRFAAFAWPAVVDLRTGEVHSHQGRVAVGGIYAGWMRQQTGLALNQPSL